MNARHPFPEQPSSAVGVGTPEPALASPAVPVPGMAALRHVHRPRDFGVGYGNSSGYGSDRHYIDGHVDPIFRCV